MKCLIRNAQYAIISKKNIIQLLNKHLADRLLLLYTKHYAL